MNNLNPMLAKAVKFNQLPHHRLLVQPKIDGLRALWNPALKQLHTRNGNPIVSCQHIINAIYNQGLQDQYCDGELFTHALPFQVINGLVRKKTTEANTLKLQYHIFDKIDPELSFKQRADWLQGLTETALIKPVTTVKASQNNIQQCYRLFLDQGFEGIIIRDPDSAYHHGRGKSLLKIKPTADMEATLVGFEAGKTLMHQHTFGSLVLQLANGKVFNCAGFSEAQRQQLWDLQPIGQAVTFLYEGLSEGGIPRFPRFKSLRDELSGGVA